jgi:Outer membrane efflux protein
MRTVVLCATLAAIAVPSSARAQSLPLTESDALSRLSPDSPRVRAIRAAVEVARADVLAAGRWPNPRLTFDREAVAGVTESMWMIAQPLPISGRRGLEQQAASALVDAASNRTDDAVRRARVDLQLAFAQLVAGQVRERDLTTALLSPVPRCRRGILALVVRGFRFWITWRACRHPDDDGKP